MVIVWGGVAKLLASGSLSSIPRPFSDCNGQCLNFTGWFENSGSVCSTRN
jgi:hypothetical protein